MTNMRDLDIIQLEEYSDEQKHRVRHFNKERFCKKNKLGHGQYGPHIYENDRCKMCGKIDPKLKHINYEEIRNEQISRYGGK
ncbi:MAG: hypothetical protein PHS54_00230 [Clostridia bacterium]|nr:hypothetical protein [Clostridia bacterium]